MCVGVVEGGTNSCVRDECEEVLVVFGVVCDQQHEGLVCGGKALFVV